ncbi:MAG: tryptophan-rich sensory protein [Clostridia bacterium]|nr:tryptophan-rich sensory protein [Clostridia bacterium]
MWKKIKPYVIYIGISLGVGALAAFLTKDSMDIYESINTPPLTPPGWLFPVVWSILYVLMGIGAARVSKLRLPQNNALFVFFLQLGINFFWSIFFFNLRAFLFSFLWLLLLWLCIILMIKKFRSKDKIAAYLQIPYLLWVTFAAYLNFAIWFLNR